MTASMEQQSKTGHDVIALPSWEVHNHAAALAPVDDVMQRLIAKYGPTNQVNEYLARPGGHWIAVPSNSGSQNLPPVGRVSVLKEKAGFDVLAAYRSATNTRLALMPGPGMPTSPLPRPAPRRACRLRWDCRTPATA